MKKLFNVFVFLSLLILMLVFPYIPMALFQIDLNKLPESMKILYELSCNVGFMIVIYTLYHEIINDNFKKYFKNFKENVKQSIKYYAVGLAIMIISNIAINIFFNGANPNNENAVRTLIDMYPLYMFFSVGIYAPFIEELIFRKSIKDAVIGEKENIYTKYLYIILSGVIFSAMHVIGATSSYLDYLYIIPYMSLGIAFAALYHKTDNIFTTITMHSLHNIVALILYLAVNL